MKRADGEGGVCVPIMRLRLFVVRAMRMNVEMNMAFTLMFMRVRVDVVF